MNTTLMLFPTSRMTAGVLLLTIGAIEYCGWFMLRTVRGNQPVTTFQQAFFRAGHAHAGVLAKPFCVSHHNASSATQWR